MGTLERRLGVEPRGVWKRGLLTILFAIAFGRCIPYGDEETDFTWQLCPGGEKYERRYLYYGIWSEFYRVNPDTGACDWSAASSSWLCPGQTIRCDARRCGLN